MSKQRVKKGRIRTIKAGKEGNGLVVYWMSRDQRVRDNWALLHAQDLAIQRNLPLAVVFCIAPSFLGATLRQYDFLLKGLAEVEGSLQRLGIPFSLLTGDPAKELPRFIARHHGSALVTDFDPLRIKGEWKTNVAKRISIPFYEVDAHNIVPCWIASPKQEYGAYTLRPKLRKLVPDYLDAFPKVRSHPYAGKMPVPPVDWDRTLRGLKIDRTVPAVDWIKPGESAARTALRKFIQRGLRRYDQARNDPSRDGQSGLSPYLHFGQLSAQRVALEVMKNGYLENYQEAFLEELITRRELSDNFCYYNRAYDSAKSFPHWAKATLQKHRHDRREHLYTLALFEAGQTHDDLWNAAQQEMVVRGKMHGYLRMYWAKKILEWSRTPASAMKIAIFLNDKYELDGRDPNGYAGIAWSIGGVHDRPWGGAEDLRHGSVHEPQGMQGEVRCRCVYRKGEGMEMNKPAEKQHKEQGSAAGKGIPATTGRGRVSVPARLRHLDRTQRHAVLATVSPSGPHTSLIAFALTKDGKGLVFATPVGTAKYRNMMRDAKVSVLIDSRENSQQDYLGAEAVTITGRAREVRKNPRRAEVGKLLLNKHPELAAFIAASTTALISVGISRCFHVGRFQIITAWQPGR